MWPRFLNGPGNINGSSVLCTAVLNPNIWAWHSYSCSEEWDQSMPNRSLSKPAVACAPHSPYCDITWIDANRGTHRRMVGTLWKSGGRYYTYASCLGPVPVPGVPMLPLDSAWAHYGSTDYLVLAEPGADGYLRVYSKSGVPAWAMCWGGASVTTRTSLTGAGLVHDDTLGAWRMYYGDTP